MTTQDAGAAQAAEMELEVAAFKVHRATMEQAKAS